MELRNHPLRALALFAACALQALPASADSLSCAYSEYDPYEITTEVDSNGKPIEWTFDAIREDTTATRSVRAVSADPSKVLVKIAGTTANPTGAATITLYKEPQADTTRATDVASFALVAVAPGETTVTVNIVNDRDSAATITFKVKVGVPASQRVVTFSTDYVRMPEGGAADVTFTLGTPVSTPTTFNLTSVPADADGKLVFPATVQVLSGKTGSIHLEGVNESAFALTLTDPGAIYDAATFGVSVTNVPPSIAPSTDRTNPTPWPTEVFKNQAVEFPVSIVLASDPGAGDQLSYRWNFGSAFTAWTTDPDAVFTNVFTSATAEGAPRLVSVEVSDGVSTVTGYYSLEIGERTIAFDTPVIEVGEGSVAARARFTLSTDVESNMVFNVTCDSADAADHVTFPDTVTVRSGKGGSFAIDPIDGSYACSFRLTDPSGTYDSAEIDFVVSNRPPVVSASTEPTAPTPWGQRVVKNQNVVFRIPDVGATDPGKKDILTYTWSFASGDSSSDPNRAWTNSWGSASAEGSPYLVYCDVSDGEATVRAYFAVTVEESVTLYTDTAAPWAGLKKNGGIGEHSTFSISQPIGVNWDPDGSTEVAPGASVRLNAVLEPGSYPFGWFGSEEFLRAPNATIVPNPSLTAYVTMPTDGDATVFYFASYPFYHTDGRGSINGFNTVWTDPFGDFDGDGLSDTWEDFFFQDGLDKNSASLTTLPVGIPTGDYGRPGNLDGDWLPTSAYEPAPDEDDPAIGKIGWPVVVDDGAGGSVTNRVRVYKYPLDFSTGRETYNKSASDEKTLFGNFVEYRGLAEDRTGGPGNDPTVFIYYAPELVGPSNRGNCPGTDPTLDDTDVDGFTDGWEYYFWSTILNEVHPENWRAWDPTYSLYRTASASAGIPMLHTDDPLSFTFTIDPTPGYVIDPATGDYRTTYEVDKDVIKENELVMPIRAGTVTVSFDGTGFVLVTRAGQLTTDGRDALFYQQWSDTDGDGTPDTAAVDSDGNPIYAQLTTAWVDALSGEMHVPGWDVLNELTDACPDAATIGMDTTVTISYERLDGIFDKSMLLSRFDPMSDYWLTRPTLGGLVKSLGLDEKKWDPSTDLDGDGVLDFEEYLLGTDPLHWDTDRDGMPDGWEVQRGLNPLSPLNGDGTGPRDNPDEDYMATAVATTYDRARNQTVSTTSKHIYAYLTDLSNRTYWNGSSYAGFVPGKAATGGDGYSNLEEFLYSWYGIQSGLWFDAWHLPFLPPVYGDKYYKGIYPVDWPATTTNPCDNDTNLNGVPDGWEAYVGWNPIDGNLVTPLVVPPPDEVDTDLDGMDWRVEFMCTTVTNRWPETATKFIGPNSSFSESTSTAVDDSGSTNSVTTVSGTGTQVTVRAFSWPSSIAGWTNKRLPTDPWNADTDGDGLGDLSEFSDEADHNGDEIEFANFDPTSVDTDLDWLPDGWEWLMGTYLPAQTRGVSKTDPYGPYGDPDGDGLPNYQEYLTAAVYGWRHDHWYRLDNQQIWIPQKRFDLDDKYGMAGGDWPYDPGLFPTMGPVVKPHRYDPMDFFAVPQSSDAISEGLVALRDLEKSWSVTAAESPSIDLETVAAFYQRLTEIVMNPFENGPDGPSKFMDDTRPSVDPVYNTDVVDIPGKKYFQYHTLEQHKAIVAAYEGLLGYLYSYAQRPYGSWDPALNNTPSGVPFTYIPFNDNSPAIGFPGTRAKDSDSDHDGMKDYWEVFHGMNPTYGGCVATGTHATSVPDSDWDGTDNWMMGSDPNYVLNLHLVPLIGIVPRSRVDSVWYPEYPSKMVQQSFGDGEPTAFDVVMERAHYDLVNRPWLTGDPSADCDHDGLNNQEESYDFQSPDTLQHTDPTPYWMTDISQSYDAFGQGASHVNLYYVTTGFGDDPADYWWWEYPYTDNDACNGPPTYLFDFEINEGYDTDNNNVSDREELTDTSSRGKSDPLDLDSPRARKAMYFDGNAACRTQRPFFHDMYALSSFTVEFWVRPDALPEPGRVATLVQRPVMMPVDVLSGSRAWAVRNTFFVYLDEMGRVNAEVDNDGIEQPANRAVVQSSGRLVPGAWTHVAVVMDSKKDSLDLYLNGAPSAHVSTSLKPCTGTILDTSYQNWDTTPGEAGIHTVSTHTVSFSYSPAPIVLGAYETNPWGVVGVGNPQSAFNPNRFFKGWLDEVRIWDRCRTRSEIVANQYRRFTKEDVEPINHARFVWDMEHLYATDASADFPQKLLYLYSFDNVPDVVPAADRDPGALVYASETDPVPAGWDKISASRPVPYVPWWAGADNRSAAYSADLSFVPFIENTVSHMPQFPPRDVGDLVPLFDSNWNLAGYRPRLSTDWNDQQDSAIMTGDTVVGDISYQYEATGASALLSPSLIPNSMDPYGDLYRSGVSAANEVNPWNFGGALDNYGIYRGTPVHSDLVPLLDAVADIDVPMWDGFGKGADANAIDSDGDGLPDWWELVHGLDAYDATGFNGAYGDEDGDGLDNYAEYLAGTDPHTAYSNADGHSDYFSRASGTSLTWGEMYDDGDGMDNAWEIDHGLDPNRFDAAEDLDNDGWSNLSEFLAGTSPDDASSFPIPQLDVTFDYDGDATNVTSLIALSYGQNRAGTVMGGPYDGRYSTHKSLSGDGGVLGQSGKIVSQGNTWDAARLYYGHIETAQLTVWSAADGSDAAVYQLVPFNEEMGQFVNPAATNLTGGLFLLFESGTILSYGDFTGKRYVADYTIDGYTYPVTFRGMVRTKDSHMVEGYNRFFGFMDQNANGEYDVGEPAGLSVNRPTLVGFDTVQTEIPLTDELWGFPRISWPAYTNQVIGTTVYRVIISTASGTVAADVNVPAPRTYLHENDLINAGIKGLSLGAADNALFHWTVFTDAVGGNVLIAEGDVRYQARTTTAPRRAMSVVYPDQKTTVYGSTVELRWRMDWRNAGVYVTVEKTDGADKGVKINNLYVPLPVRHGKTNAQDYWYSCVPQMENGASFVTLPSGTYKYTIKENPNTTAFSAQSVTGTFTLSEADDSERGVHSISGTVQYFGKVMTDSDLATIGSTTNNAPDFAGTIPAAALANLSVGSITIQVRNGADVVASFSDKGATGVLQGTGTDDSLGWSGSIDYETGAVYVRFARKVPAGYSIVLVQRSFPTSAPLLIQAFRLADTATTGIAPSGTPIVQLRTGVKGPFVLNGLPEGTYSVRAFLDSNGNGLADTWETQGYGVQGGSESPILKDSLTSALPEPLVIKTNLRNVVIVLRDRDTDNDRLPDAWEYLQYQNLATSGYDQKTVGVYVWEEYADGELDSDPRTPDTDLDGLTDAMELHVTRTDTHKRDTDDDGVSDLEEFLSGSDPLDPADARRFATPALAFDADGAPYVDCPYPRLEPGIVLAYELQRKAALDAPVWETVAEQVVASTNAPVVYGAAGDGVTSAALSAGIVRMKPADQADLDWNTGFFRLRVYADYGRMTDNGDGTCTYWTWMPSEGNAWAWAEAARGTGTLVRDAEGNWSFVSDATGATGTLVRDENGDWSFQD